MKKIVFYIALFAGNQLFSQENGLEYSASFTGDFVQNFSGGIKQEHSQLGLIDLSLGLHTEEAGMWQGGEFFVHAESFKGSHPSSDIIGDAQVASNIDGYSSRLVYECWYSHKLGGITMLAGLHNMNDIFNVSDLGGSYINSSFGIMPSISVNNAVSIFPITTLGFLTRYDEDAFSIASGIYNHNHQYAAEQSFTLSNHNFSKGFLSITEFQFHPQNSLHKGVYKAGLTYRNCNENHTHTSEECTGKINISSYFIADQPLYEWENNTSIAMFVQSGFGALRHNPVPVYMGAGFNFKGFLTKNKSDEIGIAVANARINEFSAATSLYQYGAHETVLELTTKLAVNEHITLHPDIQYIVNPGGASALQNALVGLFRAEIEF